MTATEIQKYLNTIKSILDSNGRLQVLFNRDKNSTFRYLYNITKSDVEEVIRTLEVSDFIKTEYSKNNRFKGRKLYFFAPIRTYNAANGRKDTMKLYVKIDLYEDNKMIVVVSFHEYNDFSEEVN